MSTRYTDVNFLAGSGVILSATNDDTRKRVDITIVSSVTGGVTSVSNTDGTLDISPTTGAVVASRASIVGDVSVPSASNVATLATVNSNVGTFGAASAVGQFTVNAKGLTTAAGNVPISIFSAGVSDFNEAAQDATGAMVGVSLVYVDATPLLARAALTGDVSATQDSNSTTLATVNANVGTFGTATQVGTFTVNGKGLITAASNTTIAITSGAITDFNEAAQDAVGTILTDTTSVDFSYSDVGNTISAAVLPAGVDHNSLANLTTGDVHTQYLLASGTRALTADWDAGSFEIRAQTLESDVITGTAPLTIASTTLVTNLNADLLDGKNTGTSGNVIPLLDGANTWSGVQTMGTTTKIQFTDTNAFINASSSGNAVFQGATTTTIGVVGDIILGDSTLRTIYPQTASKIDLGKSANPFNSIFLNQGTLGNAVLTVQSTATNDDPTEFTYQNRVATTDATVTTLHTFTVPTSTSYMITAYVVARRTGGSAGTAEDGAGYVIRGMYKNTAGTVAIIGAVSADFTAESQAGWDATLTTSGATVLCRVTGAVNNNVTWHLTAKVWQVAT